jgi:hypothetical protein
MAGSAIGRAINERSDGVTASKPPCTPLKMPNAKLVSARAEDLGHKREPNLLDTAGFRPWFPIETGVTPPSYAWMLTALLTGAVIDRGPWSLRLPLFSAAS